VYTCIDGGMFVTSTPPWDDSHSQSASAGGGGVTFKRDVLLLLLEGYVAVWCGGEKCKCGAGVRLRAPLTHG